MVPFLRQMYVGMLPALVVCAVNVTVVPEQMVPEGLALTEAVTAEVELFTDTCTVSLTTQLPFANCTTYWVLCVGLATGLAM